MAKVIDGAAAARYHCQLIVEQNVRAEDVSAFHHVFGGTNSIHTDPESARRSQIDGVVQHGVRTLYPIIGALLGQCRSGGDSSLRVEVKFLAPIKSGDTVSSSIGQLSSETMNDSHVTHFEVVTTNQDQKKTVAGTATITTKNSMGETDGDSSEIDVGLRGSFRSGE